jgi:hypothetical protein
MKPSPAGQAVAFDLDIFGEMRFVGLTNGHPALHQTPVLSNGEIAQILSDTL